MKNEHASLNSSGRQAPVLRSVTAQGRLEGLLLSMVLRQTFRNESDDNMEVVYTFPLAWGAVLLGLEATLAGKRLAGQVVARREARERYEQAVEQGDAPIMVEKAQGGVFSASLGSLKPGEEATIELTYAQMLSFEQGRIRLVVPTTIAPRYGDAVRQGRLQPDQVAEADLLAEHAFGLSITLGGPVAHARVGSPTHAVSQQREGDAVTVALQGQAWLDRDFVLLLEGLEGRSFAIAGPDPLSGEGHHALIASYCPAVPPTAPAPLRLKILVDCSGSMAGQSMAQARDALRPLAAQLDPQDQVAFSRFGSKPQRVLTPMEATPRNVQALVDAIDGTDADLGGTETADALADTFALRMGAARHGEEADVLLITDGEVWDAQGIVDAARRSGHRIYALGVGSAPAESLLREMAEATGGACEFATPGEDMAQAIQRLLARIRLALPVQAHLETRGRPLWSSPMPRRWAGGETVHLFMRLPATATQAPGLQIAGQVPAAATLSLREDDLVARLVAAREIGGSADKARARELAERYQLVTEDTNLLLVAERAEADKTDGMPALHKVRQMLAAGWGGTGQPQPGQTLPSPPAATHALSGSVRFCLADSLDMAADASRVSAPSVWRTNRTAAAARIDALFSDGCDDLPDDPGIPAFHRKQNDPVSRPQQPAAGSPPRQLRHPGPAPGTSSPAQIIAAFNRAATLGQAFRPTLRAVTGLALDTSLCQVIVDASQHVGGPLKAWACYLLWLHGSGRKDLELTPVALAAVRDQLRNVSAPAREAALERFEAYPACTPESASLPASQ